MVRMTVWRGCRRKRIGLILIVMLKILQKLWINYLCKLKSQCVVSQSSCAVDSTLVFSIAYESCSCSLPEQNKCIANPLRHIPLTPIRIIYHLRLILHSFLRDVYFSSFANVTVQPVKSCLIISPNKLHDLHSSNSGFYRVK